MHSPAFDLINSEWWYGRGPEGVEDRLLEPEWVEAFGAEWGFDEAGAPSPRERAELAELRAVLRRLVDAVAAGLPLPRSDVEELDQVAACAPVRRHVTAERRLVGIELVPARRDWRWARSEIASAFAELLADGEWERIKLCANDECRWVFYDESKNRRRRWCGAASCGDLDKVRRFRERQRATAAKPATARPRRRRP